MQSKPADNRLDTAWWALTTKTQLLITGFDTQEKFTLAKEWHLNEYSSMPLTRKAWQEDSLEPGLQDLPLGSDPQVARIIMPEEPASEQVK